jgi:hypothetical protein
MTDRHGNEIKLHINEEEAYFLALRTIQARDMSSLHVGPGEVTALEKRLAGALLDCLERLGHRRYAFSKARQTLLENLSHGEDIFEEGER